MLLSDRLVLERQPVPGRLLPPPRDRDIVRGYAYRVTFCDHEQLAALSDFVASLEVVEPDQPDAQPSGRLRRLSGVPQCRRMPLLRRVDSNHHRTD